MISMCSYQLEHVVLVQWSPVTGGSYRNGKLVLQDTDSVTTRSHQIIDLTCSPHAAAVAELAWLNGALATCLAARLPPWLFSEELQVCFQGNTRGTAQCVATQCKE